MTDGYDTGPGDDLNPAKVREVVDGDLAEHNDHLHPHTGHVSTGLADLLSWSIANDPDLANSDTYEEMIGQAATRQTTEAVHQGNTSDLAFATGVTEQDLDASQLTLPSRILSRLENNGALATILVAGAPNSGKTNTVWLLVEIASGWWDDLLVLSNAEASIVDIQVTSCHDLAVELLEHRDTPKFVVIDEGSTHFDARTHHHDVATQWSPLLKRMSKLSVEAVAVIGHTGKDVDPEMKRLTNLAIYKTAPEVAEFFAEWDADADFPQDRLFGGSLKQVEATTVEYDPDDPAPWSWNMPSDIFKNASGWEEIKTNL